MLAAGVGAATVLYRFNPVTSGLYPVCHFHQLTGLNCPGCGMTRAIYALLHGEVATAWRDNALLMGLLLWGFLRGVWFGLNRLRGKPNGVFFRAAWLWPLLGAALLFTVLRNLPAGAMLSP
jgi:hypothetical protein